MLPLTGGLVTEQWAVKFCPGNQNENADAVALTCKQARAVLALVAGDTVDGLDDAVERLTAAVS